MLSKKIPDKSCILIANDWLELGMISMLGLQNPVIQILHGNYPYYYELAVKHQQNIDFFLPVSSVIKKKLQKTLPDVSDRIYDFRFPIPRIESNKVDHHDFNAIFFVRDVSDVNKQYFKIPVIGKHLFKKGVKVKWHIVGDGISDITLDKAWAGSKEVKFYGLLSNIDLIKLLLICDVMILPSLKEGFPVSVVEAMKCGVIPLITDWDGVTEGLVIENKTGFLFDKDDVEGYVTKIEMLYNDRARLQQMQKIARDVSEAIFHPEKSAEEFEQIVSKASSFNRCKIPYRVYGSRLDQKWIPNIVTKFLRKI